MLSMDSCALNIGFLSELEPGSDLPNYRLLHIYDT